MLSNANNITIDSCQFLDCRWGSSYQEGWGLYMYCRWGSIYQEGRIEIPLTALIAPQFYGRPKPGHGFPTLYAVVFFWCSASSVKMKMKAREVIVHFVYIG